MGGCCWVIGRWRGEGGGWNELLCAFMGGWMSPVLFGTSLLFFVSLPLQPPTHPPTRPTGLPLFLPSMEMGLFGVRAVRLSSTHPPTHPPTHPCLPAAHANRLLLLHPPTHPPTHLPNTGNHPPPLLSQEPLRSLRYRLGWAPLLPPPLPPPLPPRPESHPTLPFLPPRPIRRLGPVWGRRRTRSPYPGKIPSSTHPISHPVRRLRSLGSRRRTRIPYPGTFIHPPTHPISP